MLLSFNWLKQYLKLPPSVKAEEVAARLKLSTVEVEKIINEAEGLKDIVVGKVLSVEKHPNADKLKICQVDVGREKLQIVCGGSNVRQGMLCAAAKLGAKVRWHGAGEPVEMKEAEIRGVKSFGMICASEEIGLGEIFPQKEEKEILDLSAVIPAKAGIQIVGCPLAKALDLADAIFEIDNKSLSNRPDLWGHYGVAREIAALFNIKLLPYQTAPIKGGKKLKIQVEIKDKKLCPRYMAVAIEGVKINESPDWLKKKLLAIGLRPINNIVDITNYVMCDFGQPMHAFDMSKVKSQKSKVVKIFVRLAKEGETLKMLDGVDYKLDSSALVIADAEKPIALAGIIGGLNSSIDEQTQTIIFESANFDASCIRKTSIKLGLRTDSSARFEKSLDQNLCEIALRKAVDITLTLCPEAKVASPVEDKKSFKLLPKILSVPLDIFEQKIGWKISAKDIVGILKRLGFAISQKGKNLAIKIPTWRATKDISIAEDIVEEAARIYGYDKIPSQLPSFPIVPPATNQLRCLERETRDILAKKLGYSEVYNYSFVSLDQIKKLGDDEKKYLELDNPLSKEQPYLSRHLLNNLLENIKKNIEFFSEVKIFEIGKTYSAEERGEETGEKKGECLPRQDTWLTAVYGGKKDNEPFWQARQAMEALAQGMCLPICLHPLKNPRNWQHIGRCGAIMIKEQEMGAVYEVNPRTLSALNIQTRVGVLEINLSKLVAFIGKNVLKYEPLPVFPEVARDLAIIVKKNAAHSAIQAEILKTDPLVKKVDLFDFYEGDKIERGEKSLAYHLTYRHLERTLTAAEVDAAQEKIIKKLAEKFNAQIRN